MKYFRNFLFHSMHDDWYICESDHHTTNVRTVRQKIKIIVDFYNGDPDVLDRCTFLLHPLPQNEDKFMHCKGAIGPDLPKMINGQTPPQLSALVPSAQAHELPVCIPTCSKEATAKASSGTSAVISTRPPISRRKLISWG